MHNQLHHGPEQVSQKDTDFRQQSFTQHPHYFTFCGGLSKQILSFILKHFIHSLHSFHARSSSRTKMSTFIPHRHTCTCTQTHTHTLCLPWCSPVLLYCEPREGPSLVGQQLESKLIISHESSHPPCSQPQSLNPAVPMTTVSSVF